MVDHVLGRITRIQIQKHDWGIWTTEERFGEQIEVKSEVFAG
jgi:hypothetical protein